MVEVLTEGKFHCSLVFTSDKSAKIASKRLHWIALDCIGQMDTMSSLFLSLSSSSTSNASSSLALRALSLVLKNHLHLVSPPRRVAVFHLDEAAIVVEKYNVESDLRNALNASRELYFEPELRCALAQEGSGGHLVRAICAQPSERSAYTALHGILSNPHLDKGGCAFSPAALIAAVAQGHASVVELFVSHPKSRSALWPRRVTQRSFRSDVSSEAESDASEFGTVSSPLVVACSSVRSSCTDAVIARMLTALLTHPAIRSSMHKYGGKALEIAASWGLLEAVSVLLADRAGGEGFTLRTLEKALHVAARWGHRLVVDRLLALPRPVAAILLQHPSNARSRVHSAACAALENNEDCDADAMLAMARSFLERPEFAATPPSDLGDVFSLYASHNHAAATCLPLIVRHAAFVFREHVAVLYVVLCEAVNRGLDNVVKAVVAMPRAIDALCDAANAVDAASAADEGTIKHTDVYLAALLSAVLRQREMLWSSVVQRRQETMVAAALRRATSFLLNHPRLFRAYTLHVEAERENNLYKLRLSRRAVARAKKYHQLARLQEVKVFYGQLRARRTFFISETKVIADLEEFDARMAALASIAHFSFTNPDPPDAPDAAENVPALAHAVQDPALDDNDRCDPASSAKDALALQLATAVTPGDDVPSDAAVADALAIAESRASAHAVYAAEIAEAVSTSPAGADGPTASPCIAGVAGSKRPREDVS